MRVSLVEKNKTKSRFVTKRGFFGGIGSGKPDKNKKNRRNRKRKFSSLPIPYPSPTPYPEFPEPPKLPDDEGVYAKRKKYTRRKRA